MFEIEPHLKGNKKNYIFFSSSKDIFKRSYLWQFIFIFTYKIRLKDSTYLKFFLERIVQLRNQIKKLENKIIIYK